MKKINCWEFKKCGRQPDGECVNELGVCPAAAPSEFDGVNKGIRGGRFCWVIAGTFCGGEKQGVFAKKFQTCLQCDFFKKVDLEEGRVFVLTPHGSKKK